MHREIYLEISSTLFRHRRRIFAVFSFKSFVLCFFRRFFFSFVEPFFISYCSVLTAQVSSLKYFASVLTLNTHTRKAKKNRQNFESTTRENRMKWFRRRVASEIMIKCMAAAALTLKLTAVYLDDTYYHNHVRHTSESVSTLTYTRRVMSERTKKKTEMSKFRRRNWKKKMHEHLQPCACILVCSCLLTKFFPAILSNPAFMMHNF